MAMMALSVFHSKFRNCSDLKPLAASSAVQITWEHHPLLPWPTCNPASEFVRNWCHPVLIEVTLEWDYKFKRGGNFFFTVIWRFQLTQHAMLENVLSHYWGEGRSALVVNPYDSMYSESQPGTMMSVQSRETELLHVSFFLALWRNDEMNYFLVCVSVTLLKLFVLHHFKEAMSLV